LRRSLTRRHRAQTPREIVSDEAAVHEIPHGSSKRRTRERGLLVSVLLQQLRGADGMLLSDPGEHLILESLQLGRRHSVLNGEEA
jgi:hypothetical protein